MPLSEAIAVAGTDIVAEKEREEQRKSSGESAEEGGEATSSSSMKSPVTPAAVCEANGSLALRWKSYTAKQKEFDNHGKHAAAAGVADPRGKLVINLCGVPRSVIKVSPSASDMKASTDHDMGNRRSDVIASSQGHASHQNEDDDDRTSRAPIDVTGAQSLPSGSSESVPCIEEDLKVLAFKHQSKASDLAKKVCRRIRMVRRALKVSQKPRTSRTKVKAYAREDNSFNPRHNSIIELGCNGRLPKPIDADEDAFYKGTEEQHADVGVLEHPEITGSEDLIYSENESLSQRNVLDRSVDYDAGRSNGKATSVLSKGQPMVESECLEHKMEVTSKDMSSVGAGQTSRGDATVADTTCSHIALSVKGIECTARDLCGKDLSCGRRHTKGVSHDAGAFSETSKLDIKEQTVLETLLRDEPTGYSSGGGSEPSRSHKVDRSGRMECIQRSVHEVSSQSEDSDSSEAESDKDDAECSQSDGYDEDDSVSSESHECEDEDCNCNGLSPSPHGALGKGVGCTEQVPSVLCDAEGNVWHIGKRAEQARGKASVKQVYSSGGVLKGTPKLAGKSYPDEVQEEDSNRSSGLSIAPYCQQIDLNWKWPSDADYTISTVGDALNRSMVFKERAVFVGCIPDGTEKLEEVLCSLMEKFLERFDFAPGILSQIQLVKVVKDFAFLELATEKVAHIVLAANQLDVFEWGVNGFHFNIEGCKGTHTSVRPLIEYMPLKPARVVFVGNIPKSRWQKEYLEVLFARILRGADGPADCRFVNCVYLLPESCDAYVELASEIMADAVVFKCTKNPQVLKEIGEDVFICRDPSSVPLMSKHKGNVCPQRSLFVGVSAPGQEFKIDTVRKIFEEILPMVSRESNQPGYLEFISVQPGKDYAFFQFNSESIVNAVMQEYIENTHLFVCSSSPLSYIILRPPEYERPGAKYRSSSNRKGGLGMVGRDKRKRLSKYEICAGLSTKRPKSNLSKQLGTLPMVPRRFGDEPPKKTDCILSIGVSPPPKATWNGLPSTGSCAPDPECTLVIEGLPKGFSHKLLRGALNELFEKSLYQTGLLEVGMLVLRHLDRDGNLDVVASLPSAKFVNALLSLRKTFVVAGSEIRLLPRGGRRKITWNGKLAEHGRAQGDVSCLSDDEVYLDEPEKCRLVMNGGTTQNFIRRKRARSQNVERLSQGRRNLAIRRNGLKCESEVWCDESLTPLPKKVYKGNFKETLKAVNGSWKAPLRHGNGKLMSKATSVTQWKESISKGKVLHARNVTGPLKFGNRELAHVSEGRLNSEDYPEEILHIVSEGGKRKIQTVGIAPNFVRGLGKASFMKVASMKRKLLHFEQDSSAHKAALIQKNFKKLRRVSGVL